MRQMIPMVFFFPVPFHANNRFSRQPCVMGCGLMTLVEQLEWMLATKKKTMETNTNGLVKLTNKIARR